MKYFGFFFSCSFFFTFSDVGCFVYCVILSSVCVLLSSVCANLLQVPDLTALAYVLVSQNCSYCFQASGNEMFCSHFILRISFSISQSVHCLELAGCSPEHLQTWQIFDTSQVGNAQAYCS